MMEECPHLAEQSRLPDKIFQKSPIFERFPMSLTEQSVQAALQAVIDANTGKDLVTSRSAKNIKINGADVSVDVELGYPAKSQIEPMRQRVVDGDQGRGRRRQCVGERVSEDRLACGAKGRQAGAGREEHHRRCIRQGRRRQIHHRRQPGAGAVRRGRERRHSRCRHLWPLAAADARHRQRPARIRRRQEARADGRPMACRPCRSASSSTRKPRWSGAARW